MIEIKPLADLLFEKDTFNIFLAGSIEQGKAEQWQSKIVDAIKKMPAKQIKHVRIFNPRRDQWDSSWENTIENKEFVDQVEWELEHIERSHLVVFYLQPETMSPISLYELGLVSKDSFNVKKSVFVCCPKGFHRKGNVDIITSYFDMEEAASLDDLIKMIKKKIVQSNNKK